MRVNTASLKLGVRIESASVRDGNIVMSGFAGTLPCETILTPAEALRMARLCLEPRILMLCLRALFRRRPRDHGH